MEKKVYDCYICKEPKSPLFIFSCSHKLCAQCLIRRIFIHFIQQFEDPGPKVIPCLCREGTLSLEMDNILGLFKTKTVDETQKQKQPICKLHENKPKEHYCKDCHVIVCKECSLNKENEHYDAFYSALNYIEIKMRNKKEIISYLKKKEFNDEIINETINKLEKLNLLNSKSYIQAFVNDKINLSSDGPYKIKKSLLEFDFNEEDIDNYLNTIDENIWLEKLKKIANKKKSIMKSKSYYMFVSKMKNDLYNLGYDKYMIENVLSNIEYDSNALSKDLEKANKKFKGDKTKIINSLLRKGYSYEEINTFLK